MADKLLSLAGVLPIIAGQGSEPIARLYRRERGLAMWILLFTRSGRCFFRVGKKQFIAQTEDLILICPGSPHEYGAYGSDAYWSLIWVHFQARPHWQPWLAWPEVLPGILRLTLEDAGLRNRVTARLEQVVTLGTSSQPFHDELALNALEEALLWCCQGCQMEELAARDSRIDVVTRHLCEHPELDTSVMEMAKMSHLSPSRFAHRFRELLHMTPLQFLEQQRMRRAGQLLRGTMQPVGEVARAVGIDDAVYFAKRFERLTGVSPTQFRQKASTATNAPPQSADHPDDEA